MFDMKETRVPTCRCPYCDTLLDAATPAEGDAVPEPGDLSVCIKCASPLVFDGHLRLRKPYLGELASPSHPQLDVVMRAVRSLDRR